MITIVLLEAHKTLRELIKEYFSTLRDFRLAGETGDPAEAVELVRSLKPHLLIIGIDDPELTRQFFQEFPTVRIIKWSLNTDEYYALTAFSAGAKGYVIKDSGLEWLVSAVRAAMQGERFLSPPLTEESLETYRRKVLGG